MKRRMYSNRPRRAVAVVAALVGAMYCVVGHSSVTSSGPSILRAEDALKTEPAAATHTVHRATPVAPLEIPPVLLTDSHQKLCKVKVGDTMPEIELPQLSGQKTKLADLFGKEATVVVFFKSDRRMAKEELEDLVPDVIEPFGDLGVKVVGIAVSKSSSAVRSMLSAAKLNVPVLMDSDGSAFAAVGSAKLPRTYVLDKSGKIVWFDIEYSMATRRELGQVLQVLTSKR